MMPYRIDFFAFFILLGIVQAIFLCVFFFSRENRKSAANVFYGLMLLAMALCIVEIFMMYTGYIQHALHLVDFSEPLALLIGPCFYLYTKSLIYGKINRKNYFHFLFPVVYLFLLVPFFLQAEDVKFNSWVTTFDTGLEPRQFDYDSDPRVFWLTNVHTELTLISIGLYLLLSLYEIARAFRSRNEMFFRTTNPVLKKLRFGLLEVLSVLVLILVVKLFNEDDTGDHLFAAYISMVIYVTSFGVLKESGFFRPPTLADPQRVRTTPVSQEVFEKTLRRINEVMLNEKPFLNPSFSLPDFAQRVGTTVHTLSQVINDGLGKNFFELTAEYRVEEAKRLLKDHQNIKIEEIAERVGYNSKSSLNNAFKKVTGMTPSEYRSR